jgi:three-Cys-motif partner protein
VAGRYNWKSGIPPLIDEHSAAKHRVLRRYVENYIQILCLNPRRERLRLIVVDGFCGGGVYQDSAGIVHPGSPLILRRALQAGRAVVQTRRAELGIERAFELDATLYLNDKDRAAITMLNAQLGLEPDAHWSPDTQVTRLQFDVLAERLIEKHRGDRQAPRIIFILDQYGLTDASLPVIRRLFSSFPKAEVILTFAIDSLANFASEKTIELYRKMLAKMGFDEAISAERLASLKAEDDGAKHLIQTVILREVFPKTGASYATPFFIIPKKSRRGYWLLHLANNTRANDEMKNLHWQEQNHFMHFGAEGLNILAFDPLRLDATPQFSFDFGSFARERALQALEHDLVRRVHDKHPDGIALGDLLASVANETPSTREMIKETVFKLGHEREIEVRSTSGRARKRVDLMKPEDEVVPRRQLTFF